MVLAGCSTAQQPDARAGNTAAPRSQSPSAAPSPTPSRESPSPTRKPAETAEPAKPAIRTGWGPTRAEIDRARSLVSRLSLRERAGQVIVARYDGTGAPTDLVNSLHLGGVIVFDENFTSIDQLRRNNRRLQESATQEGRRWPVFIGVDQEGGIVERVKGSATRFPSFMTLGAARTTSLTTRAAAASGAELRNLGFTVAFAPDADVTSGPSDPTIGSRSAGSRPRRVATQVNAATQGYLSSGVLPVLKHFPGHGSVPADSHLELPVQDKSLRRLLATDLVPFRSAVADGVSSLMIAHIDVRAVDPGVPSTVSRKVITGLLRNRLGFDGLVVTDALNMGAITDRFSSAESAVRALRAGADVLLMPPSPRAARDGVVRAVRSGSLSRARLDEAAVRQVAMLLHQRRATPSVTGKPGSARRASYRASAAGITVASGPCSGRLVGRSVRATGSSEAVARFNEAAAKAGLETGSGTSVALIGYGGSARSADIVVSTDTPYVLGQSTARTAKIAVYGDTPGAMRALTDVLLGKAKAPGRLPVEVSGVARTGC